MMEAEWDEDEEREALVKVDILLYTLSVVLWFRHPDRPDELPNMCETLHLLGLVDRKYLETRGSSPTRRGQRCYAWPTRLSAFSTVFENSRKEVSSQEMIS